MNKISSFDSSPSQEHNNEFSSEMHDKIERELLDLKKQLKDTIEENNFLRSVNAVSSKDKKSSSKQHLKLELMEMKKIVNRLTEAVT